MKHANISFFVPHVGCPNQCSFCSQRQISGTENLPQPQDVHTVCRQSLAQMGERAADAEIAFFGGSFTMIARDYMCALLEAASLYIGPGKFSGIRFSTRPDGITPEILQLLSGYPITFIELGAQSLSDAVLQKNQRGHTAADVRSASCLIRQAGYGLGLQMMTGLYGSDDSADLKTARHIVRLRPDAVRIYPTVVMRGTQLASLYEQGGYAPQSLEDALSLCARLLALFSENRIDVIRLGLHAQESLQAGMLAGPYHPAFRELCIQKLLSERILPYFSEKPLGRYRLVVSQRQLSAVTGHGAPLLRALSQKGFVIQVIPDKQLSDFHFYAEEV